MPSRANPRKLVKTVGINPRHHSFLLLGGASRCLAEIQDLVAYLGITAADTLFLLQDQAITIERVRSLISQVALSPHSSRYKAVVAPAYRLGWAAAEAMLKVLEEPPGRTLFFLYAPNDQLVLPTIVSRCQRVYIGEQNQSKTAAIPDWLEIEQMPLAKRFELALFLAENNLAAAALDQWIVEVYDGSDQKRRRILATFLDAARGLAVSTNAKLHLEALFYKL